MPLEYIKVRSLAGSFAFGPLWPNGEMKTSAAVAFNRRNASASHWRERSSRRAAFADDQVGRRQRIVCDDRLAVIEIRRQQRRSVRVDAGDIGADIGEQPPADGGGEALADLDNAEA